MERRKREFEEEEGLAAVLLGCSFVCDCLHKRSRSSSNTFAVIFFYYSVSRCNLNYLSFCRLNVDLINICPVDVF